MGQDLEDWIQEQLAEIHQRRDTDERQQLLLDLMKTIRDVNELHEQEDVEPALARELVRELVTAFSARNESKLKKYIPKRINILRELEAILVVKKPN